MIHSKTIGNILIQSGAGVPIHSAPIGSIYIDYTNSIVYSKKNIGWIPMSSISYGNFVFTNNSSTTSISTTGWVNVPSLYENNNVCNGVRISGGTNKIEFLRHGKYEIKIANTVFSNVADNEIVYIGLFHNDTFTSIRNRGYFYQSLSTDQKQYSNIPLFATLNIEKNDTINLVLRSENSSTTVVLESSSIFVKKIL